MKKIIITGAGGYLGSQLTKKLVTLGNSVSALDTFYFGTNKLLSCIKNKYFQLKVKNILNTTVEDFSGFDTVVHLAAISNDPSCELDEKLTIDTNYLGTIKVAENAKKAGVSKFIFMSSCSVYGKSSRTICDENSEVDPQSLYAFTKYNAEKELLKLNDEHFQVMIIRSGTIFGVSDRMRFDLAINKMVLDAINIGVITINGEGKQFRPFVHIQDVVGTIIQLIQYQGLFLSEPIFNLAIDNINLKELALLIQKQIPARIEFNKSNPDTRSYIVSITKLVNQMGYLPVNSIAYGVRELKNWFVQDGNYLPESTEYYTVDFYKQFFHIT